MLCANEMKYIRRTTSGAGGRGEERGGGLPFLKIEKKCPDFGKMCPVCVRLSAMD